jgi:flagellar hook-length control protein FliK
MQWQVQEDSKDSSGSANTPDDKQPAWNSVLHLDFPGLGKVSATLRLVGEHVQVQLRAQNDASKAALKAQGDVLSQSLAALGTTLDGLTVHRDDFV